MPEELPPPHLLPAPAPLGPPPEALPFAEPPCPADPPTPVVALRLRVPASVGPGKEIEYHLCVENESEAPAHHVLVRNPLPKNARYVRATPPATTHEAELRWDLGTLGPCACKEIVLVLEATGGDEVSNCARVQFEHGQCVRTRLDGTVPPGVPAVPAVPRVPGVREGSDAEGPRPQRRGLTVTKRGPKQAVLYDSLTFDIVVQNNTDTPIHDIVVTETLPAGLEHAEGNTITRKINTLLPSRNHRISYDVIAKKPGDWCSQTVVTWPGGREEAEACVRVGESKLQLSKTGPERHLVGLPARYEITVTNTGTERATNVVISDVVPADLTFVSASEGGKQVGGRVEWAVGPLAPGARRTVQLVLRAQTAGRVRNEASVTADRDLSATAAAETRFEGGSGLTFGVVGTDNPVEVGKEMSYLITVVNQGNVAVNQVRVEATVPEQMEVQKTQPGDAKQDGRKVTFEVASLPPGATAEYRVFVKTVKEGDVRFEVALSADILKAGPVRKQEATNIAPNLPSSRRPPGVREELIRATGRRR